MAKVRIAVVGCGAVAHAHLPSLEKCPRVEVVAVVDKQLERAKEMAASYHVPAALDDYRQLVGRADAAVLALPHHLHAPVAVDLLQGGLHVLVEKPMAVTVAECDRMIDAAERNKRVLVVGHVRRWFDSSRFIKRVLDEGWLGPIRRFEMREGFVYEWPAASDFTLRKDAGGGVLADAGVHALDTLLWWLGPPKSFDYYDDAEGGVEADCELHLRLACGAEGLVELSRTRNLRNTVILEGERGRIEVESKYDSKVSLQIAGTPLVLTGFTAAPGAKRQEEVSDLFDRQIDDFAAAVLDGTAPFVPGREGRAAVALIEACHAQRQPLSQPWASWR